MLLLLLLLYSLQKKKHWMAGFWITQVVCLLVSLLVLLSQGFPTLILKNNTYINALETLNSKARP